MLFKFKIGTQAMNNRLDTVEIKEVNQKTNWGHSPRTHRKNNTEQQCKELIRDLEGIQEDEIYLQ